MCGIVGYTGFRNAKNVLLNCLKKLDYRGYDSAGVAIFDGKKLRKFKEIGEISNLEKKLPVLKGNIGVGHTRWATHGEVNKRNAHPHVSCDGKIAVVHNGIIENFKKLREDLEKKGHKFLSETDTEVIAHLIEEEYKGDLKQAVSSALKKVKGSYAVVVVSENEPDKLVGARKDSPLVVGVGDNENFFASDIPAVLNYTNRFIYLEDKDVCVLTKNSITVFNNQQKVNRKINVVEWSFEDAEKGGFPHFMLKEIYEQPHAIQQSLRGRISEITQSVEFDENIKELLHSGFESISIVACGTSFYAGLIGKYIIEQLA
ncbi:MAG TPA: glutamine--fructose-6-phosphate transaminase (isomerizing), partial [Thermoplasmatales archaeon]|nr:glutamine--fructose-6-phosphate transaminase (isomerizing) [Thermoplasmatales archaeon]